MKAEGRRRPHVTIVLAALVLLGLVPLVSGCGLSIVSLDAPTNVDIRSAYNVTMTVAVDGSHSLARGVVAFRYPEHWDVATVTCSGSGHEGDLTYSPNMAGFFDTDWEATYGSRDESVTWNYVWWAGYTPAESWANGDTVTVTITFSTHYKMATALLAGYMLDVVTGFSDASDPETVTDEELRSFWAFGANGEALGQRVNVPVNLYAFTDVRPADPYYYAIEQIAHRDVVDGYYHDDTTREFRAAETLNRAQFCKMVVRSLTRDAHTITEDEDAGLPFVDLGEDNPSDLYWHEYIARAYELGVTTGTGATTFSPWLTLPRCQAVSMMVRAVSTYYWPAPEDPPADYVNAWGRSFDSVHGPNAWRAEYWGLLDDIPLDGAASDPWAPIPRGEMAQLIWNAIVFVTPPHYLH